MLCVELRFWHPFLSVLNNCCQDFVYTMTVISTKFVMYCAIKGIFFLETQEFCRFNFPTKISLQYFLSNFSIVGNCLTNLPSGKFKKKRSITTISGDQGLFLAQTTETIKRLRVNLSRVARAIIARASI